jgi:hypothetical protein
MGGIAIRNWKPGRLCRRCTPSLGRRRRCPLRFGTDQSPVLAATRPDSGQREVADVHEVSVLRGVVGVDQVLLAGGHGLREYRLVDLRLLRLRCGSRVGYVVGNRVERQGAFPGCRCSPLPSPSMSNSASWAVSAGNKFREVARTTENPTTKLLAEGLTHLSEAVRELHQELWTIETKIKNLSD